MILILAFLFVFCCLKWSDWRNWKLYYPTIIFFIAGDFIYLYVLTVKPLWQYTAHSFSGSIATMIVAFIIYPSTVLLFLSAYPPSGVLKKISYVAAWILLFSVLEYLAIRYNYLQYYNGWNFAYSILFDCLIFPLLLIHHRKPPAAWLISCIFGIAITFLFNLPAPSFSWGLAVLKSGSTA